MRDRGNVDQFTTTRGAPMFTVTFVNTEDANDLSIDADNAELDDGGRLLVFGKAGNAVAVVPLATVLWVKKDADVNQAQPATD